MIERQVLFGDTPQDVASSLGAPSKVFFKAEDKVCCQYVGSYQCHLLLHVASRWDNHHAVHSCTVKHACVYNLKPFPLTSYM